MLPVGIVFGVFFFFFEKEKLSCACAAFDNWFLKYQIRICIFGLGEILISYFSLKVIMKKKTTCSRF